MSDGRAEHLAWCKARALEYVDRWDYSGAVASMTSDLGKHPETGVDMQNVKVGLGLAFDRDVEGLRTWINNHT
jgi:pterin-4a-carbinolamine dehydratase